MIDWMRLLLHVCWILGASLMLAEYSHKSWEKKANIPDDLYSRRGRAVTEVVAILMLGFGLAMTADLWWRRLLWVVVALLLLLQLYLNKQSSSSDQSTQVGSENEAHD